jgi:hypothetical protein
LAARRSKQPIVNVTDHHRDGGTTGMCGSTTQVPCRDPQLIGNPVRQAAATDHLLKCDHDVCDGMLIPQDDRKFDGLKGGGEPVA